MKKIILLMLACVVSTPAVCMKRAADPQWKEEFDRYEKKQRAANDDGVKLPKVQAIIRPPKKSGSLNLPHFRYNKYGKTEVYVRLAIYPENSLEKNTEARDAIGVKNLYCTVNPKLLNITEATEYPIAGRIAIIHPLDDVAKKYYAKEKEKFFTMPYHFYT